jgi:hypothetical protein
MQQVELKRVAVPEERVNMETVQMAVTCLAVPASATVVVVVVVTMAAAAVH